MNILVHEYTCGGALAEHPGCSSLKREGLAMLTAVLDDFARWPGARVTVIVEPDLVEGFRLRYPPHRIEPATGQNEEALFADLAKQADFALVIAPETGGILAHRCRLAHDAGCRLLGPSPEAVATTTDKGKLAQVLAEQGIPTPRTTMFGEPPANWPVVVKPRDGAGSQATFRIDRPEQWSHVRDLAREDGYPGELIVQPFVPGQPASVAIIAGQETLVALPAATQELSSDGRFRYLGGRVPLAEPMQSRAQALALRAARAVPGLVGYFGVDMVLGEADQVIEINPRLTTSYVGLRRVVRGNLMWMLVDAVAGVAVGMPEIVGEEISFKPGVTEG